MKAVLRCFIRFVHGVWKDYMLFACILMPLIMGALFFFGIPPLEAYLCREYLMVSILKPYYLIFDLVIAIMTPIMFAFSGVMTTLEELDNGTARYLMVTPIGQSGYLISRIGLCSVIGIIYSIVAIAIFGISGMSLLMNIVISIMCALTGLIVSIFVIAFAGNKVEGMALIKLSGIIILGIPAVFFLPAPMVYITSIFPSYWFTLMAKSNNYFFVIPTLIVSLIWLLIFSKKFSSKLT